MDNSEGREEYKQAEPVNAAAVVSVPEPEEAPEELTVSEIEAAPATEKRRSARMSSIRNRFEDDMRFLACFGLSAMFNLRCGRRRASSRSDCFHLCR